MPCHEDVLACLRDELAGVPTGLRITEALLSDRLALALLAGCILGLACLVVMVGKICLLLLYDDIHGNEEWRQPPTRQTSTRQTSSRQPSTRKPSPPHRTPTPQNRRTHRGQSPTQRHEGNRVQAESAQVAQPVCLQAARPDVPPPGLSVRRLEGPPASRTTSRSGMSMSDQALHTQGRQPVNQDPTHRSMRRSGSEGSLSTKGPPATTPTPRARASRDTSAANVQGAGSRHGGAPIHKSDIKRSMSDQALQTARQPVNHDLPGQRMQANRTGASHGQSHSVSSGSKFYAHVVKSGMKRSMSDQVLHTQARQQVDHDPPHRSMRRSGSGESLSITGAAGIKER